MYIKALDYRSYILETKEPKRRPEMSEVRFDRLQKRMTVQMKTSTFSGHDPIAVLNFLNKFKAACDINRIPESLAVWCFQFFVTGRAHSLVMNRLTVQSIAVDVQQQDTLTSYREVVNFLLRTYATDEIIAESHQEVIAYQQSTNTTETDYGEKPWDKELRCGSVYSEKRVKGKFVEGLLPAIKAQMRTYRVTRRTSNTVDFENHEKARKSPKPIRISRQRVLAPESSYCDTDAYYEDEGDADMSLAITTQAAHSAGSPTPTWSSQRTSDLPTGSSNSSYRGGGAYAGNNPRRQSPFQAPMQRPQNPSYPSGGNKPVQSPLHCLLCFSDQHETENCPNVPVELRDGLIRTREANDQRRRQEGRLPYRQPWGFRSGVPRQDQRQALIAAQPQPPVVSNVEEIPALPLVGHSSIEQTRTEHVEGNGQEGV